MMPAVPVLMVLYTNDAVEVRYSDGSRLHLLPCGTSFSYHTSPESSHPIHGMKTFQQRCCFVTSEYRQKVLSALDFRNRFAERPYVCQELLQKEQSVPLYARIKEIAWPKTLESATFERLVDGGIKLTSADEFASFILSPHQRDFTVCYLSLLSQEKQRERTKINKGKLKTSDKNDVPFSNSDDSNSSGNSTSKIKSSLNISPITQASCADSPQALSHASGSPITPQNVEKDDAAKYRPFSTPTRGLEGDDSELVCTPYGKTAVFKDYGHKGLGNREEEERNSFERNKSEHVKFYLKGPQDICKEKVVRDFIDTSKSISTNVSKQVSKESQYMKSSGSSESRDITLTQEKSRNTTNVSNDSKDSESETRCFYCWVTKHVSCDECPVDWSHVIKLAKEIMESKTAGAIQKGKSDNSERKNGSKSGHPVKKVNKEKCMLISVPQPLPLTCPGQHLHKQQSKLMYDDGKNPLEDPSTFRQGRLKVLLVDGVVYRIVRLSSMKLVEIYPGDGTVIVSQGISGHFFLHILPSADKVEERTYSIKSLPPSPLNATYSVEKLIKRAFRFLVQANQEEKILPSTSDLCCWKYEDTKITKPLPTSMLEECLVPGYGKFSAFSNGQVRIVFDDRTSLDMTWDFSKRIQNCLEHSCEPDSILQHSGSSSEGDGSTRSLERKPFQPGCCKLLLPSGKYQLVDVKQPGVYQRYINMAIEWADWINSSPTQRRAFYQDREPDRLKQLSAERELQKINCFNYVVENTLMKRNGILPISQVQKESMKYQGTSLDRNYNNPTANPEVVKYGAPIVSSHHMTDRQCVAKTNICGPNLPYSINSSSDPYRDALQQPSQPVLASSASQQTGFTERQSAFSILSSGRGYSSGVREGFSGVDVGYSRRAPPTGGDGISNSNKNLEMLQGFHAVRQALLKTSSMVKDIDEILDKRKS